MIGVDIVKISRIELNDLFINRILTTDEKEALLTRKSVESRREFVAGRFAAKEALFKATGNAGYLHYSVLNDETGKPYVKNHPEIEISLSHDGGLAIAMVYVRKEEELSSD